MESYSSLKKARLSSADAPPSEAKKGSSSTPLPFEAKNTLNVFTAHAMHNPGNYKVNIGCLIIHLSGSPIFVSQAAKASLEVYRLHYQEGKPNVFSIEEKTSASDEIAHPKFQSLLEWFVRIANHPSIMLNLEFNAFYSMSQRSASASLIKAFIKIHKLRSPTEKRSLVVNFFGGGGDNTGASNVLKFKINIPEQKEALDIDLNVEDVTSIAALIDTITSDKENLAAGMTKETCRNGTNFKSVPNAIEDRKKSKSQTPQPLRNRAPKPPLRSCSVEPLSSLAQRATSDSSPMAVSSPGSARSETQSPPEPATSMEVDTTESDATEAASPRGLAFNASVPPSASQQRVLFKPVKPAPGSPAQFVRSASAPAGLPPLPPAAAATMAVPVDTDLANKSRTFT